MNGCRQNESLIKTSQHSSHQLSSEAETNPALRCFFFKALLLSSLRVKIQTHISLELFWSEQMYLLIQTRTLYHWRKSYYGLWTLCIWVKRLNAGLVSASNDNWWTGVLCCFYQTLILTAPIHIHAENNSTNLIKKQTHPDLRWTESEHIFSRFVFLAALSFNKATCLWYTVYRSADALNDIFGLFYKHCGHLKADLHPHNTHTHTHNTNSS